MKHKFLPFLLLALATSAFAQEVRMRDLFAEMPDSILRLLTKNNRLDCIDFIENNMPAQVNNLADEPIELTALTDDYLRLTMSSSSYTEMKLLPVSDTTRVICMVKTYMGPIADSNIRFYDLTWKPLPGIPCPSPEAAEFMDRHSQTGDNTPKGEEETRRAAALAQLRDTPFVKMELSAASPTLTLTLQAGELTKPERTYAEEHLHPLQYTWTGGSWQASGR